jgi:hypothetical protein
MSLPKFPRTNSLPGRALARLLKGDRLTHRSFQNATSSYRLAHFIFVLRGYGWAVNSIEKTGKTGGRIWCSNQPWRKTIYAEYFFNVEDIRNLKNEFGEVLDKFISAVDVFEQKGYADES